MGFEGFVFYVDDDFNESTPGWNVTCFDNIQNAVDVAVDGDTVFVYSGFYSDFYGKHNSYVFIDKKINLIGEDKYTTIIDGANNYDIVHIFADDIIISGFTIQNSGNYTEGGALFDAGFEIHSDFNTIQNNIISNHPLYCINFWASKGNNISYNLITRCNRSGIDFLAGPNNIISNNMICNNYVGISALGSSNFKDNILSYNTFINNNKKIHK